AATVARILSAVGPRGSLVGLGGDDAAAATLRAQLAAAGMSADGLVVDRDRPTTEKVRVVTERNQQVARIDYERDADAAGDVERAIVEAVAARTRGPRALLVSDYLKGTITRSVIEALIDAGGAPRSERGSHVPLIIDPKIPHLSCYA